MKKVTLLAGIIILGLLGPGSIENAAGSPLRTFLKEQITVQKKLIRTWMERLDRAEVRMQEAWTRVQRGGTDFFHATDQGEAFDSLSLRDEDLRSAESELMMGLLETQQARRTLLESIALLEEWQDELKEVGGEDGDRDILSGKWKLAIEPGEIEGVAILVLDGTLVQGRYELDGGFRGSLRGTLVGGRVRMERIDSQLGFAAVYYGRIVTSGDDLRLEGKWEATRLATGLPAGGSWVAEKMEEENETR